MLEQQAEQAGEVKTLHHVSFSTSFEHKYLVNQSWQQTQSEHQNREKLDLSELRSDQTATETQVEVKVNFETFVLD